MQPGTSFGRDIRARLRRVPAAVRLVMAMRAAEHALRLRFARRRNYVNTQFCRLPTQLDVLVADVVDFLLAGGGAAEIRVLVFGCSIGCEPYSIASLLLSRRPDVKIALECFDIEPSVIARATRGIYSQDELTTSPPLTPAFVAATFDPVDGGGAVKPAIAGAVSFALGNVLDTDLIRRLAPADVVVAQNFLYHLPRADAERALRNLFSLMKPRSALLVDGADPDIRTRLTEAARLRPCTKELEQIHRESRIMRGAAWPRIYWGLEPFDAQRSDAARRFATIFLSER